ncbi:hypothetical protein [Sphingobium aromaticiconvertens]
MSLYGSYVVPSGPLANLLDERDFPDSCCADRITPGQPRNWRLSLSRHF